MAEHIYGYKEMPTLKQGCKDTYLRERKKFRTLYSGKTTNFKCLKANKTKKRKCKYPNIGDGFENLSFRYYLQLDL